MSLLKKMGILLRAGKANVEEAVDDATMDVQLEQSLRDAQTSLAKADERRVMQRANVKKQQRVVSEHEAAFASWTEKAKLAKNKDNLELAKMALTKRNTVNAQLEPAKTLLLELEVAVGETDKYYEQQKLAVTKLSGEIDTYKSRKAMNDTRESIQKSLGTGRDAAGDLASTLERAKNKQAEKRDMLDAADDMNTDSKLNDQFAALKDDFNMDDELNKL
tara:strand:- start:2720 stop:3376 length:657 start_codon:yes stop_codon:yes gene_type:complete